MKNGSVANTDYVRFGSGVKNLVMLPGLGDGLRTVKGTAAAMAWLYRVLAKDYTVYMFSRKNNLAPDASTRDMARDLWEAMCELGICNASILGVSMGGMIAQWLAIDHPECVEKLILVVTCAEPNAVLTESITEWMQLARRETHREFMDSNLKRIYSESYYRKNRWTVPLVSLFTKPKSYERFQTMARACLTHNAASQLEQIACPTFVVGGERDMALGGEASRKTAEAIPDAQLKMYPQWGHGLYEESPDFLPDVLSFLREV